MGDEPWTAHHQKMSVSIYGLVAIMSDIKRHIKPFLIQAIEKGKSILLLGPRQTGKTTLIQDISSELSFSLIQPRVRLRYEKDPSILADEIEALHEDLNKKPFIIIDEIQKVPELMDVIQDLVDRKIATFLLTGSSARKLKRHQDINLLPGRVLPFHLDPLSLQEMPKSKCILNDLLIYGALPAVILEDDKEDREELLDAYVSIYLEEEIRAEAVVRNLGSFARFLELAAGESGKSVNYSKLSQQLGVAHTTIASYYQILEDCLIVERIEPYTETAVRRKLTKAQKYIFFDLGVRRLAAREGENLPLETMGHLFEQFIALELLRVIHIKRLRAKLHYWRDSDGPEVDWVINHNGVLIPIEVKWTDSPSINDAKHLLTFLNEYPQAKKAYVVCRTPRKMKLHKSVDAISWQELDGLLVK